MTSRFDVASFKSKIDAAGGLTSTSLFTVKITPRTGFAESGISTELLENAIFLCDSVALPGVSFARSETKRYGTGPLRYYPTAPIYGDLALSFYCDNKGKIINFLNKWMQQVISISTGTNHETLSENNGALAFEVNYKEDYAVDITIDVYDSAQNTAATYTIINAYPTSINDINLSWATPDELMKANVNFLFDRWESTGFKPVEAAGNTSRNLSSFQKLIKTLTAAQTVVGLIKKPDHVGDVLNQANNIRFLTNNINI